MASKLFSVWGWVDGVLILFRDTPRGRVYVSVI